MILNHLIDEDIHSVCVYFLYVLFSLKHVHRQTSYFLIVLISNVIDMIVPTAAKSTRINNDDCVPIDGRMTRSEAVIVKVTLTFCELASVP